MSRFHVDRQHRRRGRVNFWIVLLLLPLLTLLVVSFSFAYWYQSNLQPLSEHTSEVIVNIPEGASAGEIAELLEETGVIKSSFAFDLYTRLNGHRNDLQAGGYKISPNSSVQEIVTRLVNGDVATDLVIILPARRIDQVKSDFINSGYERDEVNAAFNPKNFVDHPVYKYIPNGATLEGFIYPDSYQKTTQTEAIEILTIAMDELDEVITPELTQKFAEQGLTVFQAITLASIVESEVPAASGDRATVAQVYLKRLAEGMPLQADPTAQYGTLLATGTADDWANYDTPYNTYLYTGLPPGPISNVSASSLEAVAYPSNTDYLFFVADDDDDNVTHFSRTFAEHEENIAKYCQVKCNSY